MVSIGLAAMFLAAGAWTLSELAASRKPPERSTGALRRPAVRVARVSFGPFVEPLTGYGKAAALRRAQVAAEVAGVVAWVSADLEAGAAVLQGAELVQIDARDLENAAARARAEVEGGRARLARTLIESAGTEKRLAVARREHETSRQELERSELLAGDDTVSRQELDQQRRATLLLERQVLQLEAEAAGSSARRMSDEADVARAEAALAQAELDLERAVVRAPYAGRISARFAEPGARVAQGAVLFEIIDLSRIEVPVALPAARFGEVEAGSAALIRLSEGGEVAWRGQVARVSPDVDAVNRTFNAFLVVSGAEQPSALAPGAFVVATIDGRRFEGVAAIPRIAFVGEQVYVAEREAGKDAGEAIATPRQPHVLRLLPSVALVDAGLEEGDEVIVTNLERIAGGSLIRVAESAAGVEPAAVQAIESAEQAGSAR
ncbi:MAG: efflux RND transporter periplasmic adaptor subunit [Planctomycetes bacterium]|nr:efflux RND transporter periplasmic adaptor subunit [Planctomycetota bacterium]